MTTRAEVIEQAEAAHAQYPQYRGHWDGDEWVLVQFKRRVTTKLGDAFLPGDITLARMDDDTYPTAYSLRNRIDTSVRHTDFAVIWEEQFVMTDLTTQLETLRAALRAESISYGQLAELQDLGQRGLIPADDLELREAAGLPEHAPDLWELLESPPDGCDHVADLYDWSTNYDPGRGPITLYLDLIGWSQDEYGEPLYDLATMSLGYVELSKLAAALTEYAHRPHDVRDYVDRLMTAERDA